MSSIVIVAEKPFVGKSIAAWLAKTFGHSARSSGSHIEVGPVTKSLDL